MAQMPKLLTERLLLRPFTLDDAPIVQQLAGDREIASTTLNIPHPYEDGMAEEWISTHQERFDRGELANWIGKPFWGEGYCTEAAEAVLDYGFSVLGLNRIYAHHLSRNPASGRVMEKIGMRYEGCLRGHVKKWDVFEDIKVYAIMRSEYVRQCDGKATVETEDPCA
jgi:ribosomal-protein-alanine N-acetyltransferase